mgnify:CR=1 FL=1
MDCDGQELDGFYDNLTFIGNLLLSNNSKIKIKTSIQC